MKKEVNQIKIDSKERVVVEKMSSQRLSNPRVGKYIAL